MNPEENETEAQRRARWDAETLGQAKDIEDDAPRLAAAQTAAAKLAKEREEQAKDLNSVAGDKGKAEPKPESQPEKPTRRRRRAQGGGRPPIGGVYKP